MFFHIQLTYFWRYLGFGFPSFEVVSMLKNFAPLYVKPKHFKLGFSGTLRSLFVIFSENISFHQCCWTLCALSSYSHWPYINLYESLVTLFKSIYLQVLRRKRKVKVLEEDEYVEKVGKIIERDFFPELDKHKARCDYVRAPLHVFTSSVTK